MKNNPFLRVAAPLVIDINDADAADQVRGWFQDVRVPQAAIESAFWQPLIAASSSFNATALAIADYKSAGVLWSRGVLAEALVQAMSLRRSSSCGEFIDNLDDPRLVAWCVLQLASKAPWTFGMPDRLQRDIEWVESQFYKHHAFSTRTLTLYPGADFYRQSLSPSEVSMLARRFQGRQVRTRIPAYVRSRNPDSRRAAARHHALDHLEDGRGYERVVAVGSLAPTAGRGE